MANYNVSGLITLAELSKLKKNSWCVYILKCSDSTYYTGITNNVERRIQQHNTNKGAKYTKGRGPFSLVYQENCKNRAEASRKEYEIKKLSLAGKNSLINAYK
ncbi:GIY-YIG nuclease family protein [Methylophilaceae bacterium]|jgi:putative endonuclease|nr:GIY-YIG nuclease family protein [Methylophilaceae bacterium]|tara:strand:+ start:3890 stop:4198 length:309 start_codon:yes stop_codon:yes gene_type:complete